jgi:glycosyltransferase involved in cell wall biosynthesis
MEATGAVLTEDPRRERVSPDSSVGMSYGGGDPRRLRLLFFNEGDLGSHVLGHSRMADAHRAGLESFPHVEARFARLTEMSRLADAAASRPIEPLRRAGLDMHGLRWHLVQSLRARRALSREIDAFGPDVVQVYTPAVAMTMAGIMRRVPTVLAMDATVQEWRRMPGWCPTQRYADATIAPSRALEHRALRGAALVLARTRWVRESVEREFPDVRVLEHHPGIDIARYRPAALRDRERPRVLFVGGRFEKKGGFDLLDALAGELDSGRVELDIVTPHEVPARRGVRVHRLGPSDPALLDLHQQADVMCLPTHGDTNPWAILEAMACGTAVVASRVGGIADMLDDGRAGVLVECGEVRGLREALLALLSDRPRRAELAAAARARCELHYDARRQFGRLVELLTGVAGR